MLKDDTNIYKSARNAAGLTQERAAEALGVSETAIKDYESYSRFPPNDVVERMCVVYNALHLAYQHTAITSGRMKVVPDVVVTDLPSATLRLINRVMAFAERHRDRDLMRIAEDGRIDADERELFDEITAELEGLVKACLEVKLSKKEE